MAAKQKHRAGHGAAGQLQHAHRSLEKGDFRQALKDAKVGYRRQPGPETRQLLEQAYLARGRQLYRAGLQVESRAVIESLLEIGPSEDSVRKELPELLVALGLFNRIAAVSGVDSSIEEGSPYYIAAVDHAVLRPDNAPPSLPAVRQGAKTIRQALSALEAGDEAEALAALKDVARTSPLADWKYFVRGLAAYYRQDADEMRANWNRLDAGRFAARIAAALKFFADQDTVPTDDARVADALARLNGGILGKPELAQLQALQGYVAAGRWREMLKLLPAVNQSLRYIDPTMARRLAADLYATVVLKGKPAVLRKLAMLIEPPPIDPHWNRGLAMAWELYGDDDCVADNELAQAERYWRAYLDDLAHLESLLPAERTLARALVYTRLGQMLAEMSGPMCSTCQVRHDPDEDVKARAVDCFEEALTLSPALLSAYLALAEAYREWDETDKAAATWRRLSERFPENLDALLYLADYHIRREEPFAARKFVVRAQRLKPLDTTIKAMVHALHVTSARHHALEGEWDAGRAEFAAVLELDATQAKDHKVLASRAALELKAGDSERANRLLDEAMTFLGEEAPVWLMMAIECRRYALSQVVVDDFEQRWSTSLKSSRHSPAIGEMCRTLTAYLVMDVDYPGRDGHVAKLADFLDGRKRMRRWQAPDLRDALLFLMLCEHGKERHKTVKKRGSGKIAMLLEYLASRARRQFPDNAYFQFAVGDLEMRKGPANCNRVLARECFQRALELTQGANDPDSADAAKRARERLDLLRDSDALPFGGALPFLSSLVDEDEDDEVLDESPFGEFGLDEEVKGSRRRTPAPADLPKGLFESFAQVCRTLGVDPHEIVDRIADDKPFRFRTQEGPLPKRKKRK